MHGAISANASDLSPVGELVAHSDLWLLLHLDGFAGEAIVHQSGQLGVSAEELARFGVLYYLADLDSGRVARRITSMP